MIFPLNTLGEVDSENFGQRLADLSRLARVGLPLMETLAVPKEVFRSYRATGSISTAAIEDISRRVGSGRFAEVGALRIIPSLTIPFLGLTQFDAVRNEMKSLHGAIEAVYRSWSEERAVASRYSAGLGPDDTEPAL